MAQIKYFKIKVTVGSVAGKYPLGNILYELCQDVMDPVSVLRSFDKGKIKDDGSIRALDVDDYFRYINRSPDANDPLSIKIKSEIIFDSGETKVESLFSTPHYSLDSLILKNKYSGEHTNPEDSFHHLFMRSGQAKISSDHSELKLTTGHSCFIPASVGKYTVQAESGKASEILKTYIN